MQLLLLLVVAIGLTLAGRVERMENPATPPPATPPPATPPPATPPPATPPPATPESTPSPATGETPDSLRAKYNRLQQEYETLLQSPSPDIALLRRKNFELERTINELMEVQQQSSWQTNQGEIDRLRDILRRIQRDYNGLSANTDQLETLRRIRQGQEESSEKPMNAYIALFLAAAVLLVGTLFITSVWSVQNTVTATPAMISSPAETATLPQMDEYSGATKAF